MNAQTLNEHEPAPGRATGANLQRTPGKEPEHTNDALGGITLSAPTMARGTFTERLAMLNGASLSTAIMALDPSRSLATNRGLRRLASDVGDRLIREVDVAWLERIVYDGQAHPMPQLRLRAIRRAIEDAARKLCIPPPAVGVDHPLAKPERFEELRNRWRDSMRDVPAIRHAASQSSDAGALLALISGETGARLSELVYAEWPQLGLLNGLPIWTIPATKGPSRVVKLTWTAALVFERLAAKADPASPRVFHTLAGVQCARHRFRKFAAKHGLGHVRFHDIRTDWEGRTGGG